MLDAKVSHSDFIGVYENLIPLDVCKSIIEEFDRFYSMNRVHAGSTSSGINRTVKNSIDANFIANNSAAAYLSEEVFPLMQQAYDDYLYQHPILANSVAPHDMSGFQVQKYEGIGSGYHAFHIEAGSKETSDRVVTWLLYLNDVAEGGETEFLNQKLRLKPLAGTLVYFPTGYTHPHRGNPVISNDVKYVATGWLTYV